MSNLEPSHEFASDRPIERIHQDKLGRRSFALNIAQSVARRHKRESFVLSLQGAWGCGKSSLKNMVLEALKEGEKPPIVVDFMPWQLRDVDNLFSAFFDEIALAIGKTGDINKNGKDALAAYGKRMTLSGSTIKALGTLGGVVGVPGAKIIEMIGEGLGQGAKVALEGADSLDRQSLKDLKEELKQSLRELDRPVLVVIDDIDRLEVEEMLLIFQLVKANADFPNFTYLLLLHREAVETALERKMGNQSGDYLEKIIQLPIDVPPISLAQRRDLFYEGVVEICQTWKLTVTEAQLSELDVLWCNGLKDMMLHPRDVRRLHNALEFTGALMQGEAGWEVNLADFTGLETLRIQEPKAYARLPHLKLLLTGPKPSTRQEIAIRYNMAGGNLPETQPEVDPAQIEMSKLVALVSEGRSDAARAMLGHLFPQANWAFITSDEARSRTALTRSGVGLCVKESRYFDRYFALCIPIDQISEADLARVLGMAGDENAFKAQLKKFQTNDLLGLLLLELKDRADRIPIQHSICVVTALLDFGEEMPEMLGFVGGPLAWFASGLVEEILKKYSSVAKRGELFSQAVTKSKALGLPVCWIWDEEVRNRGGRSTPRSGAWATPEQMGPLRALLTSRIAEAGAKNNLESRSQVQMLVRFWSETEVDKAREWVASRVADDAGLRFFLSNFCGKSHAIDNPSQFHTISFQRDVLEWLPDLTAVRGRVAALDRTAWEKIEDATAEKFINCADALLDEQAQAQQNSEDELQNESS